MVERNRDGGVLQCFRRGWIEALEVYYRRDDHDPDDAVRVRDCRIPAIQLNTLALAAVAMVPQNQFRPQIFTFMMFSALLALLTWDNYRGRAPLWLVIPLMALWGDLHGGFIVGIATLAAYASVAGLQDLIAGRGLARALRLSLIAISGTLATLVSPYGIDAWRVVLNALKDYAAQPIIADWRPLLSAIARGWHTNPADTVFFLCGVLLMLAFIVAFVREPQGGDFPLVAIAMMMTMAAFTALRNLPLAMIACVAPLARHAELIAVRRRHVPAPSTDGREVDTAASTNARSGFTPWFAASIAAVLAVVAGLFSTRLVVGPDSPVGAVAFMNRYQLHGNLLSNFGSGEYLIWHLPTSRVFIDGRYDTVYSSKVVDQYLAFINGRPDASRVLNAYPHDYVLLPADSPALRVMARALEWKLIYRDGNWMLFARAHSAAAKIPGVPISGTAPPRAIFHECERSVPSTRDVAATLRTRFGGAGDRDRPFRPNDRYGFVGPCALRSSGCRPQASRILNDPYSYSAFGHRWDNHEWLTEFVMAGVI